MLIVDRFCLTIFYLLCFFAGMVKYKYQPAVNRLKEAGYQPLAVAPNGENPLHKDWSNRDISLDEVLSKDTDRYGIRCGDNGLVCIDVDSKHHDNPELMNKTFIDRITCSVLDLDKVVFQKTPSAGGHLFYRADTPQKNTVYSKNQEGLRLVESRGVGGQAVMYELDKCAQIADLPVLTKREEAVILEAARSFHEYKLQPNSFAEYNQTTSCVNLLLEQGWTVVSEDDVMYKVLRDGNPTSSTSASVYKDSNCAYVFSTSTKLPANKLLTPADISIELTFGGDTKAFAKAMGFSKDSTTSVVRRSNYFAVSTISDMRLLAAKKPPKMLVGALMREKENAILFAGTNAGKSVLALQIARAIARGEDVCSSLPNEVPARRTLFFDFELSQEQTSQRVKNAISDEPNLKMFHPTGDEYASPDGICNHVELTIEDFQGEFVVIDNISMLAEDNENAADAKALLTKLKAIRQRHDLSMLIVGHSPKRQKYSPIEVKDLAGSAMVGNMFDAVIALNYSTTGVQDRYLKQLKVRTGAYQFAEDNVISCSIKENETDGVYFSFYGTSHEMEHLEGRHDNTARDTEILELHRKGLSHRQIAEMVGIGKSRVGEIIKRRS